MPTAPLHSTNARRRRDRSIPLRRIAKPPRQGENARSPGREHGHFRSGLGQKRLDPTRKPADLTPKTAISPTLHPTGYVPGRPDAPMHPGTAAPALRRQFGESGHGLRANATAPTSPPRQLNYGSAGGWHAGPAGATMLASSASGHRPCYRACTYHTLCIRSFVPHSHIFPGARRQLPAHGTLRRGKKCCTKC